MEIIVTRITTYKEKDGIVDSISGDGKMSFLVRGLFDPKSKNALLNNPLTIADVETSEGKYKYPVITSSMLLTSPINPHSDLRYMASLMMISEATNYLLSDDEKPTIYNYLKNTINELKQNENPLRVVASYLGTILKISGYDFEINGCVMCGNKKSIVTFSFDDGGFICSNCYTPDIPKLFNKNQMLALREAFSTSSYTINGKDINDDELKFILFKFGEFIEDSYGYKIKSFDLLA